MFLGNLSSFYLDFSHMNFNKWIGNSKLKWNAFEGREVDQQLKALADLLKVWTLVPSLAVGLSDF